MDCIQTTVINREQLSEILEDFDVSGGMYHKLENYNIYLSILNKFRTKNTGYFTRLNKIIKADDIERATTDIHTFKGVVGMIGAVSLYKKVVSIESKLKNNDINGIFVMIDDASFNLDRIMKQIISLDSYISKIKVSEKKLGKICVDHFLNLLDELNALLMDGNTKADDICNEILRYDLCNDILDDMKKVQDSISDFEFDIASEICTDIKSNIFSMKDKVIKYG